MRAHHITEHRRSTGGEERFTSILPFASLLAAFVLLSISTATAQKGGADEVYSLTYGTGGGRGAEYQPANVLGLPDTTARYDVPSIDPAQILSLGLGGEIILSFNRPIIDGPGPDFTIFENAFSYVLGGKEKIYAEPGEVLVSRDGAEWYPFPFDSLSLVGCAGVTPTNGAEDPTDPARSGGDQFDLSLLGIDSIYLVRIRDVSQIVKSNRNHPFYDATVNGFDLDAVVLLHDNDELTTGGVRSGEPDESRGTILSIHSDHQMLEARLHLHEGGEVMANVYDQLGRSVGRSVVADAAAGEESLVIKLRDNLSSYPGPYFLQVLLNGHLLQSLPFFHP